MTNLLRLFNAGIPEYKVLSLLSLIFTTVPAVYSGILYTLLPSSSIAIALAR